jgi:SdrD B-like domain
MKNSFIHTLQCLVVFFAFHNTTLYAQSIVTVQPQKGFIVTTTNKAIYSVNANSGTMKLITTLPFLNTTANALCLDTSRGMVYFIENGTLSTNTAIFGYNYRTNTHFTLIADFKTAPGSPLIANGMGTSGATCKNGFIYMGTEAARSLSPGVSSYNFGGETYYPFSNRIYKLSLNPAGTAIINTEVFKDYYNDNSEVSYINPAGGTGNFDSDWGDFVIINDTMFERINKTVPGGYEAYSRAYNMITPTTPLYNTLSPFEEKVNQTAEDGYSNLIFVGGLEGASQQFVNANKTNGTYDFPSAKYLTLDGVNFTSSIADATSGMKGEGSIGNTIWNDINANGIKDGSEFGISNAVVELWEDINKNGTLDIVTDKLEGTAITDNAGHYSFIKVLPGNYFVRPVMTTNVNYPAQGYTASYPFNQLAGVGVALSDAGDETVGGAFTTSTLNKNFSTINFDDQTADFGFTGSFTVLANNDLILKTNYANGSVILNWTYESF